MSAPIPSLQGGRSINDFYGALSAYTNGPLRDEAQRRFEEAAAASPLPPQGAPVPERLAAVADLASPIVEWQVHQLLARVFAEDGLTIAAYASAERGLVEEIPEAERSTPELDPDFEPPAYWSSVNFHVSPWYSETPRYRTTTTWPTRMKIVDRAGLAAVPKGSDIVQQRADVVAEASVEDVQRVLDMGTGGSGEFMGKIQARFPDAEIHGVDVSARLLQGPKAKAASMGAQWILTQQNAEGTDYPDGHFDLVTSYALLHEVPDSAARNILAEAFRVLRPGGELLMGDVPPYRQIPDWQLLLSDWETEGRVEPYWREAASLDRGAVCRELGFVEVEEYGIGPTDYPWVLRARKPLDG